MMRLPFKCNICNHKFSTIDEMVVFCPKCNKSDVKVIWDDYEKV